MENPKTVIQISGSRLNHVMSKTVDMTQVEKILFTTGTSRQIVTTRHTELLSGKCISLVDQGWHLSC